MIPTYLKFSQFAGKHVHMGVTGSIASFKAIELCRNFIHSDIKVSVTLTLAAQEFIKPLCFSALGADPVYNDMFSPKNTPFAHLEPNQFADIFLIAPITANTIAKLATGLSNDLLSCQALAFHKDIVIAPAMNPGLWTAKPTQQNIEVLIKRGVKVIFPESGKVACGDKGEGKLAPLEEIYFYVLKSLSHKDMEGMKILITLGPTREFWDPVRFISNASSGKMGSALAVSAWLRGGHVICVKGPCDVWLPADIEVYEVTSAYEMFERCVELWKDCDMGCMCAAVSDFAPAEFLSQKIKKTTTSIDSLPLKQTPDILSELGLQKKRNQTLIGFAAETGDEYIDMAKKKLVKKNLDYVVVNRVDIDGVGFESDMNMVAVISQHGDLTPISIQNKADIAWKIWDSVLQR